MPVVSNFGRERKRTRCPLFRLCVLSWVVAGVMIADTAARPPNVVFIMADDLGWTDLGCFGSGYYETPHIDRLATEGIRFTSAYANAPNCAPTRACLFTGKYTPRHGIYTVGTGARGNDDFRRMIPVPNETRLGLEEVTLAEALREAGYATGMFGKWHLGDEGDYHPARRGFDEAVVTSGRHFAPDFRTNPSEEVSPGAYLADWLTDKAESFLERHRERAFFLYLSHFAVHTPIEAKDEDVARYRDRPGTEGHNDPVYAAMIRSLDASVGRIMARLEALRLVEHTMLIFYSDNGGHGGYGDLGGSTGRNITDNAPLRGGKGMLYEGGVRVPLVIRWPGAIPARSVSDEPVATIDFYPTFLELAGVSGNANHHLDGISLLTLLKSGGREPLDREALYWHFPGYLQADEARGTWRATPAGSVRSGRWKLLEFFEDQKIELYDLKDDIGETRDLSAERPREATALRERLHSWREALGAPMPARK